MGDIFLKILNMSIAASWLILAVVLFRFVLKKAPKWITVLLWGIVAIRLVVPFSFESALSLIPSAETFNAHNIQYEAPTISSGIPAVNHAVNPVLGEIFAPNLGGSINPLYAFTFIVSVIWLIGIAVILLYAVISYVRISWSVAERVPYKENIFLCDHVKSPFILGLFCPKIYLPSSMGATAMEPVIAHEKAHLARCDHWWKPVGFLILTIHWFNPLCWIAYVLLCRDIELACDEKVIQQMDLDGKKQYSTALLECSIQRRLVTICPLAFGEVGVKERVKNVLSYKKPAFWVIVLAIVACAVVTVCFATNPALSKPDTPNVERPTLLMDSVAYINPYMPVSNLPYGYQSAGKLTGEQANNTELEGIEYFVHPSGAEDFYTYQECGTPIDLNTVDSEKRQWAYMRWIQVKNDGIENWKLTLDDVVMLSQKRDALSWSDFERYSGQDIGSGLYIMRYEIDERFEVWVGGVPDEKPWYIYLRVNTEADDHIDIRTEDVSTFIEAHINDVPKVAAPQPDGGGQPVSEGPDFSTLSAEQAAVRQAILDHNRSEDSTGFVSCASFVELAVLSGTPLAGNSTHKITYYGWALYEKYKITDNGLETVSGSHIPVALSFDLDEHGYTLTEYWEPGEGSYFVQDIQEKFPSHIVEDGIDSQKFVLQQTQECYAQAVVFTGLDTNHVIGTLIETICGSPARSSNPGDYINEHLIEYRELTYYGRYTLKYCFAHFEEGGEDGMEGHIMMQACEDIATGWGEEPLIFNLPANGVLTGQMWYSAFKNNALKLIEQYSEMELAEQYPASYLLLSMLGEV